MEKRQLTNLYNERIISSTPVTRPMTSSGGKANIPGFSHQGNLIKTESGG